LLGDLLGHDARELQRETGLAMQRGKLGVWLVGEAGALLVVPGGRRVHCFCVGVNDSELPPSDKIAHLLLALRTDEEGFATVANHAFAGAPWRLRRRLDRRMRPALRAARWATRESCAWTRWRSSPSSWPPRPTRGAASVARCSSGAGRATRRPSAAAWWWPRARRATSASTRSSV